MSYKFTNSQRDAFVRSVMSETPRIDYDDILRKRMQEIFIERADKKLVAVYKDEKLREFLYTRYVSIPGAQYFSGAFYLAEDDFKFNSLSKDQQIEIQQLLAKWKDQEDSRDALRRKLRGVIYSYTSIKKAHDDLPEFKKYLPDYSKPEKAEFLPPAINDLVTDLVKAGWPDKNKENKNASK